VSALGEEPRKATPARYLEALRRHWPIVVVTVVAAVAAAAAFSILAPKRYEVGADILVTPISSNDDALVGFNVLRESADPSRSVLTAARLVKTAPVADGVRARLGLAMSRRALLDAVAVKPVGQANILSIVAKAPTSSEAARIANAFADEFIRQRSMQFQAQLAQRVDRLTSRLRATAGSPSDASEREAIQGELAALTPLLGEPDPTLHVASRAVPPRAPASPRPVLSVVIALLASLLLGSGAAIGLEVLNPRVNSEDELLFVHRLPVLARVPRMRRKLVDDYLAGRGQLPGEAWEAYRMLRANLATAGPDGDFPRTILVTSAIRGEGKTMSALNLATTLASAGATVIVVDGDLRQPMLATAFGVRLRGNGFADVFMSEAPLERALILAPGHGDRIRLVLGSPDDAHLIDLVEPYRIHRGLEWLKHQADVIIIDSPAVTGVADALTFADAVAAVLVVTRLGHTRREELAELLAMFAYRGITPTGFIVTTRRARRRGGYDYVSRRAEKIVKPVPSR
jgi:Mrp family chromosome partitioning ATPase/capsular polysaccharide biosynthesis protein